ncbi:MAG: N-formylglutamate amidohydrolase [Bacteroidales bacterium]
MGFKTTPRVAAARPIVTAPLPYENEQRADRPDICLGTDDFHTPKWLADLARRLVEGEGWTVALNRPFAGALVPSPFHGHHRRVRALMIEVNRRL